MEIESRKKIVHICPYDYTLSGGHSNAIRALADGQAALDADVTVLSYSQNEAPALTESSLVNVEIYQNDQALMSYCSSLDIVSGLVVSFCGIRPLDVACAKLCRKRGIAYVFSSGGALHYRSAFIWVKKLVYVNFLTGYFRGAAGLIATTEFERKRLRWLFPFYRGNTGVIPNIIDLPSNLPEREDRADGSFVFGFLGRLDVHNKGLDLLLEAFSKMSVRAQCNLVLVGPDHNGGKAALTQLITSYGFQNCVEIREPAYGDAKELFFMEIDCFVSLSRWEAFGISFVEAMSRGVASILSDRINLKLEIGKYGAAELVPLKSSEIAGAMSKMVTHESHRIKISETGKVWASSAFKKDEVARMSLDFYERL